MALKVMVSGCYDMLHSGHVAFFQAAATYGDLHVALGSDSTVFRLKGRQPVNSQEERLYMVKAIKGVTDAFISSGSGMLDFEPELKALRPDIFVVNADGSTPQKEALCRELGIRYLVLEREPHTGLPARSTTTLRKVDQMPYRIDLAGGWLDQPFVSRFHPGPVLTISIEPTISFNERSGMATSTRNKAIDLWGSKLPVGHPEKLAKTLFSYDNPPGTTRVSGSQDAIGIVMPGLNRADYDGSYWPSKIETIQEETTLSFLEESLYLVPLGPRGGDYDPLEGTRITSEGAGRLAGAADHCWDAIRSRDIRAFGKSVTESFEAQIAMFPRMVNPEILKVIETHKEGALGWKLSGAGGGGYVVFVAETPIRPASRIHVRCELA